MTNTQREGSRMLTAEEAFEAICSSLAFSHTEGDKDMAQAIAESITCYFKDKPIYLAEFLRSIHTARNPGVPIES
jgi:hypothetical protein